MSFAYGDQVVENYGQPNYIYFLYHGFVLENNTHDCVLFKTLRIDKNNVDTENFQNITNQLNINGFTSLNPTFCIKDSESLQKIETFLRIKFGKEDVREELTFILQERMVRIDTALQQMEGIKKGTTEKEKTMIDFVKSEEKMISDMLRKLMFP